jgi:hypothetical protein
MFHIRTITTIERTFLHPWTGYIVGIRIGTLMPEPSEGFRSLSKSILLCNVPGHFHIAFSDILKRVQILPIYRKPSESIPRMCVHIAMFPSLRVEFVDIIPGALSSTLTTRIPDLSTEAERLLSQCQSEILKGVVDLAFAEFRFNFRNRQE